MNQYKTSKKMKQIGYERQFLLSQSWKSNNYMGSELFANPISHIQCQIR